MFKFIKTGGMLVAVAMLVGACASSPVDRFYGFDDTQKIDEVLGDCFSEFVGEDDPEFVGKDDVDEAKDVHTFLNCGFRTVAERKAGSGAADIAESDLQLRMLRAHAVVGALAVYGNFSMEVDREKNRENAAVLLTSIEEAEIDLWTAFEAASGTSIHGYVLQRDVDFFDRIRLVYKVAEGAVRPGLLRAKGFVERIVAAIAGQNPFAVFTTVKDARKGIARALSARRYSAAYIRGIRNFIIEIKTRSTNRGVVTKPDFKAVDGFYLKAACDGLAKTAGASSHHCIPDRT